MIFVFGAISLQAQDVTRGNISVEVNNGQTALENVTVELRRVKDSSLAKIALTDKNGIAEFEKIPFGNYFLKTSMTNYTSRSTEPFELNASNSPFKATTLSLQVSATQLGNVTVTARKPFIQKLSDRIVVNVENSIVSAGSSALDVLERSPGVTVDQNDVISMRGRAGVIIMIDGKTTAMSGADLANYLRGLPSSAIERIDLITNPSAKYDASGNSGIIDIRMKKDQRLGMNG